MRFNPNYPSKGKLSLALDNERMPSQIMKVGPVNCIYELIKHDDYYHLKLSTKCQVTICCQRCMEPFEITYHNQTDIGLCDNEPVAEKIIDTLEPVVLTSNDIPFETLVNDELYLYLPMFHEDMAECQYSGS